MVKFVFELIGLLLLSANITYIIAFIFATIKIVKKHRGLEKRINSPKWYKASVKHLIRDTRYPFLFEVLKWHLIDIYRQRDFFDLFGIWCFTGYYGEGKTMGAVQYALKLKSKYPHIHIYTNFNLRYQDGKIEKWQDLLELPTHTIVIFDEIQSTFASTRFSDFPIDLLWKLTQCRKANLAIFASSPVYTRMSIQLRESTDYVILCKNMFRRKRWFKYQFYRASEFERYIDDKDKLKGHKVDTYHIVASDDDYNCYNTKETVSRLDVAEDKPVSKSGVSRDYVEKLVNMKIAQHEAKKHVA